MKKKIAVLVLVAVISSACAGTGYAISVDAFFVKQYLEYQDMVAFSYVSVDDNEYEKEVGDVTATVINSGKGLDVSISNGYPGYKAFIDFSIVSVINAPVQVIGLIFDPYDETALSLELFDIAVGDILDVGMTLDGNLTVTILQGASQNSVYTFDIYIDFSDILS